MKLLLDANISWQLVSRLKLHFEEVYTASLLSLTAEPANRNVGKEALGIGKSLVFFK